MAHAIQIGSPALSRVRAVVSGSFEGMHRVEYTIAESLRKFSVLNRTSGVEILDGRAHSEGMKAVCRALDLSDELGGDTTFH